MDINIPYRDIVGTGLSNTGGILTSPLVLAVDPTQDLEATTKRYVDSQILTISTMSITSGTMPAERFPPMTGDAVSITGTGVINLSNTGVIAGTYTKITVDTKGRVTEGGNIVPDDIPLLSWAKIVAGKPTTCSGYGIVDALTTAGGTLIGQLSIPTPPTETLHAVNKVYVDNRVTLITGLNVGDTIKTSIPTTPPGYLRCNGGQISKLTYANLYAAIGDRYTFYATPGSGKPWKQRSDAYTEQSADIINWTAGQNLPVSLAFSSVIITKNRIYILGGYSVSSYLDSVYTASINMDGSIGPWTTSAPLPGTLGESQGIVTKNRVYLLGGHNGTTGYTNIVYTAPINTDGTLGAWSLAASIPAALTYTQAIVTKNRVYIFGGYNGNSVKTVYTAPINSDGTIGTWTIGDDLPNPLSFSQVVTTKNRVYLLGGYDNVGYTTTTYTAVINNDGTLGAWSLASPLPVPIGGAQAVITKNKVYLFGGFNGTDYLSTVYTAPVNSDGTIGTWALSAPIPIPLGNSQIVVTKNKMLILGGYDINTKNNTYFASITGGMNDYSPYYDGSLAPTDPNNFRLPDYTMKEAENIYHYIIY